MLLKAKNNAVLYLWEKVMSGTSLCIHRAANEIGVNWIEIQSASGERLLLDAVRPLDMPEDTPIPVPPSLDTTRPLAGVVLTHKLADYCRLLQHFPAEWPVYCCTATKALLQLAVFFGNTPIRQNLTSWTHEPLSVGPFRIQRYAIEHSAFLAYALHIAVDGKQLFYSGDLRIPRERGNFVGRLMRYPPRPRVDVLLMEGTDPPKGHGSCKPTRTEESLYNHFVRVFKKSRGRVFVSWSAANIDRSAVLYKACKDSGRLLVTDLFTMLVQASLGPYAYIPYAKWNSKILRGRVEDEMLDMVKRLENDTYRHWLKEEHALNCMEKLLIHPERCVIMVRDSLVDAYADLEVAPTADNTWIWSQGKAHRELDTVSKTRAFCAPCRRETIHTSGHLSRRAARNFVDAIRPKVLVPVHGEAWEECNRYTATQRVGDGQWLDI